MTSYYNDGRLTYDEADSLVEKYIRRYNGPGSTVSSKTIVNHFDVEDSKHNLLRINSSLKDRLELHRSGKREKFKIE